jgi:hypothetical protein
MSGSVVRVGHTVASRRCATTGPTRTTTPLVDVGVVRRIVVAPLASGLASVCGYWRRTAQRVFAVGHGFQVSRIDAMLDPTEVVKCQPCGDRPDVYLVREAMGESQGSTFTPDHPVSVGGDSAGPEPAGFGPGGVPRDSVHIRQALRHVATEGVAPPHPTPVMLAAPSKAEQWGVAALDNTRRFTHQTVGV